MATHDRSGFPEPTDADGDLDHDHKDDLDAEVETDQQGLELQARLLDAGETVIDAVSDHPIRQCEPDGSNWLRTENRPDRKTWTRVHGHGDDAIEERVQLRSKYPTSFWTVVHQRTDGKEVAKATGVSRERAYEIAESMIAAFDGVRPENRTGRAAQ